MNIITKIECGKRNKDRVNIYIDEEYAFSVDMEIVYKEGLKVKDSVDYDKLKKVIEEDNYIKCKNAAIRIIERSYKSEKEIKDKLLKKEFDNKTVNRTLSFLKEYNLKGSIHCFSGSVEMAREFIKLGYKIGIGGIITYKNAKTIKEVVKDTDLAYILLETDSPYLAPVPHRGENNNPKYIPIIADEIASIKGTSSLDIARVTTANAEAVFDFSCEK